MRHISFVAVAIAVLLGSGNALAGRGASYSSVESAIRAGGSDAIIAELERAEDLICPACIGPVEGLLASPDYRVREVAAWWFARRPAEKARLATQAMGRLSGTNGQSI